MSCRLEALLGAPAARRVTGAACLDGGQCRASQGVWQALEAQGSEGAATSPRSRRCGTPALLSHCECAPLGCPHEGDLEFMADATMHGQGVNGAADSTTAMPAPCIHNAATPAMRRWGHDVPGAPALCAPAPHCALLTCCACHRRKVSSQVSS